MWEWESGRAHSLHVGALEQISGKVDEDCFFQVGRGASNEGHAHDDCEYVISSAATRNRINILLLEKTSITAAGVPLVAAVVF